MCMKHSYGRIKNNISPTGMANMFLWYIICPCRYFYTYAKKRANFQICCFRENHVKIFHQYVSTIFSHIELNNPVDLSLKLFLVEVSLMLSRLATISVSNLSSRHGVLPYTYSICVVLFPTFRKFSSFCMQAS